MVEDPAMGSAAAAFAD
ncbi:MAG: hypothetical protein ACTHX2_09835 [Microbacterium sp.]